MSKGGDFMSKVKTLQKKLLSVSGIIAKVQKDDPDIDNLLTDGILLDKPNDILLSGEMCQCHKNSAYLWMNNKSKYKIMTGYALSESGIWHQHSWLMNKDKIVETTVNRSKYFGYILSPLESEIFVSQYF